MKRILLGGHNCMGLQMNKLEKRDQKEIDRNIKAHTPRPGNKCSRIKRGVACTGNVSRTTSRCTKCDHLYLFKPERRKK